MRIMSLYLSKLMTRSLASAWNFEKHPKISCNLVFDKDFELSHNSKTANVSFRSVVTSCLFLCFNILSYIQVSCAIIMVHKVIF